MQTLFDKYAHLSMQFGPYHGIIGGRLSCHNCRQHALLVQKRAKQPVHAIANVQKQSAPLCSRSKAAVLQIDNTQSAAIKAQANLNASLHNNTADSVKFAV